jgi:hypothetical protein
VDIRQCTSVPDQQTSDGRIGSYVHGCRRLLRSNGLNRQGRAASVVCILALFRCANRIRAAMHTHRECKIASAKAFQRSDCPDSSPFFSSCRNRHQFGQIYACAVQFGIPPRSDQDCAMGIQTSAKDQLPLPGLCGTLSEHHLHGSGDRRFGATLTISYGALVPAGLFRLEFFGSFNRGSPCPYPNTISL